uniref:Uncharacterized protein n=1 Tax=Brassica campestris TaxID=3711 RepID=M4FID7_BRACM
MSLYSVFSVIIVPEIRILNSFVRNRLRRRLRRILIYEFVFLTQNESEADAAGNESEADAAGNESESDAAGKGSSEKEGSKELELENKATLTTIVNTLDIICRKFDQVDSRLEAYELDRNRPLMDQKTIDDRASLVVRTHQKSVNSPALVDATPRNLRPLDFLVISPAKATKDDKSTKDDKAAKDPAYGYGCRRPRIVKGEEADEKKKAAQADAAFKRKEKVIPPRDGVTRCNVQPDVEDSSLADITNEVVAEQNEFAPESDVENSEWVRSAIIKEFREKNVRLTPKGLSTMAVSSSFVFLTAIPPKLPAPPGKKEVLTADHESDFYSILIHERPWSEAEYLWVFDNCHAILSSANRENLPLLYPGPGEFLDTTSTIWFRFLSDLSLVIPSILAEGWVHDWPTYRAILDHFKERWFLQLAVRNTWDRRHNSTVWTHFNLVARTLFRCQMRYLQRTCAMGGDKPPCMLTRVWRDLVHMFEEFGPDNLSDALSVF